MGWKSYGDEEMEEVIFFLNRLNYKILFEIYIQKSLRYLLVFLLHKEEIALKKSSRIAWQKIPVNSVNPPQWVGQYFTGKAAAQAAPTHCPVLEKFTEDDPKWMNC